jgi:colanic acid biosynthesis glycosyl transferase WcaI
MRPRILFLKHTSFQVNSWFVELGIELSRKVGPSLMYTCIDSDMKINNLSILSAPPYIRTSYLSRLLSWFRYFIGSIIVAWRNPSSTIIFMVAQPPFLPIIGYLRNLLYNQKYIVWVDDVYPDVLVRKGLFKDNNLIIRLWKRLNLLMYGRAEFVTTLGPCMATLTRQYVTNNRENKNVTIIPTWVDPEVIKPLKKALNPFASKYNQVEKLTVMYSGNFGISHDIESLIIVAEKLQKYNDIHFLLVGGGAKFQLAEEASKKLQNLTALPYQPEETLPYSLACADIAVVTLDKGYEGISMPGKTYYMMSAGAALLGISDIPSDLQFVIEKYNCGINIPPGDVRKFANYLLELRANEDLLACYKKNSRQAAEHVFSKKVNVEKVYDMIRDSFPDTQQMWDK